MLTEREIEIIQMLLNEFSEIKGHQLAEHLKVTDRTVRKDIAHINTIFSDFSCKIEASKQNGYRILPVDRDIFLKFLEEQEAITNTERMFRLLGDILFSSSVSIVELAETNYYAEETIYKELRKLERLLLVDYSIDMLSMSGGNIVCQAEEFDIRRFFFKLTKDEILNARVQLPKALLSILYDDFDRKEYFVLEDTIKNYCRRRYIELSAHSLYILAWTLYFTIVRNRRGHELRLLDWQDEKGYFTFDLIEELRKEYPLYAADQVFITRYAKILGMIISNQSIFIVSDECRKIVMDFSKEIADKYGFHINHYQDLYLNFQVHIDIMLHRIDEHLPMKNPMLKEVKQKYAYAYEMATAMVPIIYRMKNIYLSDDELSYVAIYLQNYIENKLEKVSAILVSGSGLGMQRLCEQWLKKEFSELLTIVDKMPSYDLENYLHYHSVDIVISTVPVFVKGVYVVNIHEIPNDTDRHHLLNCIKDMRIEKQLSASIKDLFSSDMICIYEHVISFRKIVEELTERLYQKGCVLHAARFVERVIEREEVYPTKINDLLMIPHPLQEMAVKNGVAVAILKNGMQEDERMRMILLLGLSSAEDNNVDTIFHVIHMLAADQSCLLNLLQSKKEAFSVQLIEEERRKI